MKDLSRRQVVALLGFGAVLPLTATPARAADHVVTIKGMKFVPAELAISAGDTVTFVNEDAAPHTATADDDSFDTGKLTKGQSASIAFAAAGSFAYHCAIHRGMKAKITVA